jgi:hypothetical protein
MVEYTELGSNREHKKHYWDTKTRLCVFRFM